MVDSAKDVRIEALEAERAATEDALRLLHRVAKLVRSSLELEPTIYAILTATTAGLGLGMNRAMLFLRRDAGLVGVGAVGPRDAVEADRIWRSIEAEGPGLDQLYEAGLAQLRTRESSGLDGQARGLTVGHDSRSPIALAFARGELVVGEGDDDLDGLLDLATGVAAPLLDRDGPIGVLFADNKFTERRLEPATQLILGLVADHAARAIADARMFERVTLEARIDALTGLPHHGSLMQALGLALADADLRGASLGLIMIDVDNFKRVNDTLGHPVGDALLAELAGRITACVREPDHVYRYGGEELTVLVPDADLDATLEVAERIRERIAERPFRVGAPAPLAVTCSFGVAASGGSPGDAAALLRLADDALLAAKRRGKNRVVSLQS